MFASSVVELVRRSEEVKSQSQSYSLKKLQESEIARVFQEFQFEAFGDTKQQSPNPKP